MRLENRSATAKSDFSYVKTRFFPGSCRCCAVLQTQVPKLCRDLDLGLFYILILGTYSKFARKNNFLALGVCFPQPCSSAGRKFAASRSRVKKLPTNPFISTTKISMKCVVNCIPLRICVRSRNAQPHLKYQEPGQGVGVGFCHSCHSVEMRQKHLGFLEFSRGPPHHVQTDTCLITHTNGDPL